MYKIVFIFFSLMPLYAQEAIVLPLEPQPVKHLAVPLYMGIGLTSSNEQSRGILLRSGYEFNQYLGIESRYLKTLWDENNNAEVLESVGIFIKPMMGFADQYNIYGLIGYAWTTQYENSHYSIDENGLSLGLGLEYDFSSKREDYRKYIFYPEGFDGQADQEMGWGLFVDYQRLLIDDNFPHLDMLSVGVTYDF
jgi:hypothetical protein